MISFKKVENLIIATYSTRSDNLDWLYEKFKDDENYAFQKTFTFGKKDLVNELQENSIEDSSQINPFLNSRFNEPDPIDFVFATLQNDYFLITKGVLTEKLDIFIHNELEITIDLFVVERDISIFKKIETLINEDVYIGGTNPNAIQEEQFLELINQFPNQYEKKLYADAKITSLIKEFFSTTKDIERKFQKYLNKKESQRGINLTKTFQATELEKYETIFEKLTVMLFDENNYSENQWQKEILQIILLLTAVRYN